MALSQKKTKRNLTIAFRLHLREREATFTLVLKLNHFWSPFEKWARLPRSRRQPFLIDCNSLLEEGVLPLLCLQLLGRLCLPPPPDPPPRAPLPAPTFLSPGHSLRLVLIFDNKPSSNLSCGPSSPARRVCVVWDLNSDGGIAGGGGAKRGRSGGEIQGSQRASIHSASGNVVRQ